MTFGCESCYGPDPDLVNAFHRESLRRTHQVVDDSHFIVGVLECPRCRQRFVRIFTEFVDWSGGEDAQYTDTVPVTSAEAERVIARGDPADTGMLGELGRDRRRLSSSWPSRAPMRIYWASGTFHVAEGH
jgi:hypothetical protein